MRNIAKFNTFIEELAQSNSRLYKVSVLEKYKEDNDIKYFLDFLLNPHIVTGISAKKLTKDVGHQSGTIWLDYPEDSEIFEYLKQHNTGTDVDIWTVQFYKKVHVPEKYHELFDRMVTKNLPIGIDAKTVNEVMPE